MNTSKNEHDLAHTHHQWVANDFQPIASNTTILHQHNHESFEHDDGEIQWQSKCSTQGTPFARYSCHWKLTHKNGSNITRITTIDFSGYAQ